MSARSANKEIVGVINSVLSGQQPLEALDEIIAENFKDHAAFPGQRPGRDGFKDTVKALRSAFDQKVSSIHTVAEDDLIIDHWISEGQHKGAFAGVEATGRQVRIEGFSVWRIRAGRAVEAWGLVDIAGLMRQLSAK